MRSIVWSSQDVAKPSRHAINPGCNTSGNMGRVQKKKTAWPSRSWLHHGSFGSCTCVIRFKGLIKHICEISQQLCPIQRFSKDLTCDFTNREPQIKYDSSCHFKRTVPYTRCTQMCPILTLDMYADSYPYPAHQCRPSVFLYCSYTAKSNPVL